MDATLRYVNNRGEEVIFAPQSNFHYVDGDIRDYERSYEVMNGRIAGFFNEVGTLELEAVVNGTTEDKNRLYEVLDYDAIIQSPGRLYSGDYYLNCYCIASKKSDWYWLDGYMHASLTFLYERLMWTREIVATFEAASGADGLNYPHNYPHDFSSSVVSKSLTNQSFVPSPAKITIQGPALNPLVVIGPNSYGVQASVGVGEYLEIDATQKTIKLTKSDGETVNMFSKRIGNQTVGSGHYVFEPIPSGFNDVAWDGSFVFSVTIFEQRAEPRWS